MTFWVWDNSFLLGTGFAFFEESPTNDLRCIKTSIRFISKFV